MIDKDTMDNPPPATRHPQHATRRPVTRLKRLLKDVYAQVGDVLPVELWRKRFDLAFSAEKTNQTHLKLHYQHLLATGAPLPSFDDVEFRTFSQNGEDGILLYLFALLGTTNKRAVELCAGNGIECNTANLIVNHGWTALLVDGNANNIRRGRNFYKRCRDTLFWPPLLVRAWVSAENANTLLQENGFTGEIDLLSLDLDGIDWWLWKALDVVNPRVVVVEYQDILGPDLSVTVPYRPDFVAPNFNYCSASLNAFVKLGIEKGYRLVGVQRYGFNAFFVRNDLISPDILPTIDPRDCFNHPKVQAGIRDRYPQIKDWEWIEV